MSPWNVSGFPGRVFLAYATTGGRGAPEAAPDAVLDPCLDFKGCQVLKIS